MLQNMYMSNNWCYVELFIYQSILKKKGSWFSQKKILSSTNVFNIDHNEKLFLL